MFIILLIQPMNFKKQKYVDGMKLNVLTGESCLT